MYFNKESANKNFLDVQDLVLMSFLITLEIVLSRFLSFSVWNLKIGFSFVPVVVAAILLGPVQAAIVSGISDFIGAILFPIGAYFPGFTFTAVLTGFVFGYFLYHKQTIARIIVAVGINQLILSLLLNTLWISILYKTPYMPVLYTRLAQVAILIPVQIVLIATTYKTINTILKVRRQKSVVTYNNGRNLKKE